MDLPVPRSARQPEAPSSWIYSHLTGHCDVSNAFLDATAKGRENKHELQPALQARPSGPDAVTRQLGAKSPNTGCKSLASASKQDESLRSSARGIALGTVFSHSCLANTPVDTQASRKSTKEGNRSRTVQYSRSRSYSSLRLRGFSRAVYGPTKVTGKLPQRKQPPSVTHAAELRPSDAHTRLHVSQNNTGKQHHSIIFLEDTSPITA